MIIIPACTKLLQALVWFPLFPGASLGQLQLQQDSASIMHLTPVHGGGGMLQTGLMR